MPSAPRRGAAAAVGQRGPSSRPAPRIREGNNDDRRAVGNESSPPARAAVPRAAIPSPSASPRDASPADAPAASGREPEQERGEEMLEDALEGDVVDEQGNIVGGRRSVSRRTAVRSRAYAETFEVDPSAVSKVT